MSDKRRRLDKYMDKKTRMAERAIIFNRLAQAQASSNPMTLRPSALLGSCRATSQPKADVRTMSPIIDEKSTDGRIKRRKGDMSRIQISRNNLSFGSFGNIGSKQEFDEQTKDDFDSDSDEWTGFSCREDDEHICPVQQEMFSDGNSQQGDLSAEHLKRKKRRKTDGFKEWAFEQVNTAKGFLTEADARPVIQSTRTSQTSPLSGPATKTQNPQYGPLGECLPMPDNSFTRHLRTQGPASHSKDYIKVNREESVQTSRLLLPILAEEQSIIEAVLLNPVVIICGETGSGKTTQIPQFLYEAGFGNSKGDNPGIIGITQPRRVAAVSMAARVAHELSLSSSHVSYQIRYDATVSPMTVIKFMTDGVLLRELAVDILLNRYSVVVVDEVHERSMNTDILIGVLSRTVRLREKMWKDGSEGIKPLRLIVMSATLRISDFIANSALFPVAPPVISIPSRQHPVTIHFSRHTALDYVSEAIRKTVKIHTRLPPGGILLFLTGENEIKGVCRKLEARFGRVALRRKARGKDGIACTTSEEMTGEISDMEKSAITIPTQVDIEAEEMNLDIGSKRTDFAMDVDSGADIKPDMEAFSSDSEASDSGLAADDLDMPMHILPLYSMLSTGEQMQVFQVPPSDARLVVVATNVAETSLTIPGIRYVVDSGRVKERSFDIQNGIQSFRVSWVSKASAVQRAGRAGRTGPGHCYRLYSSTVYEDHFELFTKPEILRIPIEGIVLQMKSMNIDTVVNFPFPTAPDVRGLRHAETILGYLGALADAVSGSHITNLGRTMAMFPLSPRFSRMLVSARQHGCLSYVIAIVSALSVGDPFLHEEGLEGTYENSISEVDPPNAISDAFHPHGIHVTSKDAAKGRRRAFFSARQAHGSLGNFTSDVFCLLSVVGAYEYAGGGHKFCKEQFVRPKAMEEIHRLRSQISQIVYANFPDVAEEFSHKLQPPDKSQFKILRQLVTAGFIDQVAIRKDLMNKSSPGGTKYASSRDVPYKALGVPEDVFIHPSSILYHVTPPEYVVFHEIVRTSRPWIKTVTSINPNWLCKLGPTLTSFSKPVKMRGDDAFVIPRFGPDRWELPPVRYI